MTKRNTEMDDLRKRAEKLVNKRAEWMNKFKNLDAETIIHELTVSQIELEMQNEELRRVQEDLERSRDRLALLYYQAPAGYVTLDPAGCILEANKTASEMFGENTDSCIRKAFSEYVFAEDRAVFLARYKAFFKQPETKSMEIRLNRKGQAHRYIKIEGRAVRTDYSGIQNEETQQLLLILTDITDSKYLSMEREKTIRQKDMFLKEINHRVKNNFNIVSSLLNMQHEMIPDEKAGAVLKDCSRRILSMSYIHEQLYQTDILGSLDFCNYLNRLAGDFRSSVSAGGRIPVIQLQCGDIRLSIDQAVHCGLLVNEAVTNAVKHAFPDSFAGQPIIEIVMKEYTPGRFLLSVSDNGTGSAGSCADAAAGSLGMRLIRMLAEDQLGGDLAFEEINGFKMIVRFPGAVQKQEKGEIKNDD